MNDLKILYYDIECFGTSFNADQGFMLCISWAWGPTGKVHTVVTPPKDYKKNPLDDSFICKKIKSLYEEADIVVTWNGVSFDERYVQTRMLKNKLGYLPRVKHDDGLQTARKRLKMRRSLDNVQKFFGLKEAKSPITFDTWFLAGLGIKKALADVVYHCEQDVKVLQEADALIAPMSSTKRVMGEVCGFCGASKQKRGIIPALRHFRHRYQCKNGHWSSGKEIKWEKRDVG